MNINDQDRDVAEYLKSAGIKYDVVLMQADADIDGWKCDKWNTMFNGNSFEYHTGIGHRVIDFKQRMGSPKAVREIIELTGADRRRTVLKTKELRRNPNKKSINFEAYAYTCPPTHASVLYSLLLDSDASECSFSEWCGHFGYDTDSKKAERIYSACQDNSDKLNRIFSGKQKAKLQTLLEDY